MYVSFYRNQLGRRYGVRRSGFLAKVNVIDFHRQIYYWFYHYVMQYEMVDIHIAYKAGNYHYYGKGLYSHYQIGWGFKTMYISLGIELHWHEDKAQNNCQ
jgi:hypothetical protein